MRVYDRFSHPKSCDSVATARIFILLELERSTLVEQTFPDPYTYLWAPDAYARDLREPLPGVDPEPKVALGLGAMEFKQPKKMRRELDDEPTRFGASWFGGRPFATGQSWPVGPDGIPLTHIVQVDLGYEAVNVGDHGFEPTGLPPEGIIQLFHDTENMGDPEDVEDLASPPWAVRYFIPASDEIDTFEILDTPAGVRDPIPLIPLDIDGFMTVKDQFSIKFTNERVHDRYSELFELAEFEIYDRLLRFEAPRLEHRPGDPGFHAEERISRMSGWSPGEIREEYEGILPEVLPLADTSDGYVLLFEFNPRTFDTPGWFHEPPLQVWILKSDLDARRFENVRCLIWTDS
ncbi:DUF1963 domain-containing protein [Arthrobacter sp. MYb227]|uniref:DUF1963 domain-containing protein n=1 Tax=Arthrobacter sp. MYb227 TaxID=1848601 RepID=UPI0015E33A1E|nr:DUF1963 domain-containing protein [Arthrobacter sp. MYb227]